MVETSEPCEERPPALKRRKVRKGTQSCWECKRRKIRCTFVTPTESICDGCKSRQVECISQEFHYEPEAANTKTGRLERLESLVEKLTKRSGTYSDIPSLQLPDMQDARAKTRQKCSVGSDESVAPAPNTSISGTHPSPGPDIQTRNRYDNICATLVAAWPGQRELDLMTSVTVGISVLFHGIVCKPYSSFLDKDMSSPREILQLPPQGSHPVMIARKLLMLGSFLQGIPPGAVKTLDRLSTKYGQVMSHVVETACRLVTNNDDLVGSLEGFECIMIESMYHNNAGNLRRAWITNRRAMTMAQMMGLHQRNSPLAKVLDVETRDRIEPECMWFRLVISDRYLSLMLGLQQGTLESSFAIPKY